MNRAHLLALLLSLTLLLLGPPPMPPIAAAGFTVDSTADTSDANLGDGLCADTSGNCTLRAAIQQADFSPGSDTISFSIPVSVPDCSSGVCNILPASQLPPLQGGITIDGTSQATNQGDTNPNGPEIAVAGPLLGPGANGLSIEGDLNEVRGLIISYFGGAGVSITQGMTNTVAGCYIGTNRSGTVAVPNGVGVYLVDNADYNTIGGETPADGNIISGNTGSGVVIEGVSRNNIWGNIIGADRTGSARLPNGQHGVHLKLGAQFTLVGGELPEHGNLISGNNKSGVYIEDTGTTSNRVGGNTIGLNAGQTAPLHNGHHGVGLYDNAYYNDVGSSTLEPNVIGGNGWSGVAIVNSDVTAVYGNYIGTNAAGDLGLGNSFHGVDIYNGQDNSASANTIAYNGPTNDGCGVRVRGPSALYNIITENSIHHNGGKGIALVNGGNNMLAAPTITSAGCTTFSGTACANCAVEIFSDTQDEGQYPTAPNQPYAYADALGNWSWTGTVIGPNVTATAFHPSGNTSEFSAPHEVMCFHIALPLVLKNYPPVGP